MQKSLPEPKTGCLCGRPQDETVTSTYRGQSAVFLFHRCACGLEWTEQRPAVDASEPVSGDELIEVHLQLSRFEGSISELITQPRAS